MAALRNFHLSFVLVSLVLTSGNAFGPRMESMNHRAATRDLHGDLLVVLLQTSKSSQGDQCDIPNEEGKSSVEFRVYDIPPAASESLDAFSLACQFGFDGTYTFLREHADALALETFEKSLEFDDFCGEDCDECEIPQEWMVRPGPVATHDVMAFLGITRAKPLTVPSLSVQVWE
jgi:hypothetical protein